METDSKGSEMISGLGSLRHDLSSSRSLSLLERFFEWLRDVTWVRCMTIQKSLRTLKGLDVFNFKANVDDLYYHCYCLCLRREII